MSSAFRHVMLIFGLVLLAWLTPKVAFFIRSDWHTRRSMWQAWVIRRRWVRFSRMQGLAVTDPTPTLWVRLLHREKASGMRRVVIPRIRVRPDSYGVIVTAKTLPRVGRDEWVRAAPHLANAWGCVRVAVTQDRPGRLRLRAVRRDPLVEPYQRLPSGHLPNRAGPMGGRPG